MVRATTRRRAEIVVRGPGPVPIRLRVNGADYDLLVEPRRTLLDALRNDLCLTGTKKSCDLGECGACTVLLDGRAIYACLALAIECTGREITTIEGLGDGVALDPVQQAFVDRDAYQCGFCTPGQVMAVKALLNRSPMPSEAEVRQALSGNLCRCGAYQHIVEAALQAAGVADPTARRPRPVAEEGICGEGR
ncbi:MAG: (2Fe-2S)-binding protein [Chloroflexi bacterium]|nr:(2Fe-2S)-binding protein [Chloroflexota bacterium]